MRILERRHAGGQLEAALERALGEAGQARHGGDRAGLGIVLGDPGLAAGDPRELGLAYDTLRSLLPGRSVVGGCCGTDHRHIEAICEACLEPAAAI